MGGAPSEGHPRENPLAGFYKASVLVFDDISLGRISSVGRTGGLTAEGEVGGSIPGVGPLLRVS